MKTAKVKLTADIVEAIMRRGEISEADVYVPLSQIEFNDKPIDPQGLPDDVADYLKSLSGALGELRIQIARHDRNIGFTAKSLLEKYEIEVKR